MLGLGREVCVVRCLEPVLVASVPREKIRYLQGKIFVNFSKFALFGLDSTGEDGIITVSKENPAPQMVRHPGAMAQREGTRWTEQV